MLLGALLTGAPANRPGPSVASPSYTPINFGAPRIPGDPFGHSGADGLALQAQPDVLPDPFTLKPCPPAVERREYRVLAIDVDITLNRYGDHDPNGVMYVLEDDLDRVRAEERRNAEARAGRGDYAVTPGLQGDAIQPLVLRVAANECLRVRVESRLASGGVGFDIHDAAVRVVETGRHAALARPTGVATYEWQTTSIDAGTHYVHSHDGDRALVAHGLFAAVVVEPPDAEWRDPRTGESFRSGWDAVVRTGRNWTREFVLAYHEVGDEAYQPLNARGGFVPQVDPLSEAYRPAGRALNYRSEPFLNRLTLGKQRTGRVDESLAYSSYAYGDPATPMLRAYVGDRVIQRVLHGGSEVFHVHHVHGGSVRWPRESARTLLQRDPADLKRPPLTPNVERTDSQTVGPSETFDVLAECTAGGCQQSAGDFLYHCHVAHHYFAGMWGIWRVYNTAQDGDASTDALPALPSLPDLSAPPAGVPLSALSAAQRAEALRSLPPRGVPRGYDATVWDWALDATGDAVGEPESRDRWPGYASTTPGVRPLIRFDPRNGKPAYPMFRPHLAARPPFPPGHSPAPYLSGAPNAPPVCPTDAAPAPLEVVALPVPIVLDPVKGTTDSDGELFVLRDEVDAVRRDPERRRPLAVRARAGVDCVDVLLTSELLDTPENRGFAKVNAHIHFAQFDVQASDGVVAGFNYEQSVRPYATNGVRLAAPAPAGSRELLLDRDTTFGPGATLAVGIDAPGADVVTVSGSSGRSLQLAAPLLRARPAGAWVSPEFARYRWWVDAQWGTAYFHDHVNALSSWQHGLFGALVAEPPDASFHDPVTGAPLRSGPIADVHTRGAVSRTVTGPFREAVMFLQDDNRLIGTARSTGSSLNLRVAPPGTPGDPATALLRAYVGDPVMFRVLSAASNDVNTFHVDGHDFAADLWRATTQRVSTVSVGISERFDVITTAGGDRSQPGDYAFGAGRSFQRREGSTGLLRVLPAPVTADLRPLPGRTPVAPTPLCPADAPRRTYQIEARDVTLPGGGGRRTVFAMPGAAVSRPPVLHATYGDCITVTLTNRSATGPVTFHSDLLSYDPRAERPVAPGASASATFYAGVRPDLRSTTLGDMVALVRDTARGADGPGQGLYCAIAIHPQGAKLRDPTTGRDVVGAPSVVDVVPVERPAGRPGRRRELPPQVAPYRSAVVFLTDDDPSFGTHKMPYRRVVSGATIDGGRPAGEVLVSAYPEDLVTVSVVVPDSAQEQVVTVEGHGPSTHVGGLGVATLELGPGGGENGAGAPGDYRITNHRGAYAEAGQWGLLRVEPRKVGRLRTLPTVDSGIPEVDPLAVRSGIVGGAALLIAAGVAYLVLRRRHRFA